MAVEHHANLLGQRREVAQCEVCQGVIRLREDAHWTFAFGEGQEQETHYRVASFCSLNCVDEFSEAFQEGIDWRFRPPLIDEDGDPI